MTNVSHTEPLDRGSAERSRAGTTQMETRNADVVIIGGGVAGASLATVLARGGLDVLVLERDLEYRDRNKGEAIVPWGWAEAARMDIDDVLAAGDVTPEWRNTMPDGSSLTLPAGALLPGVPGVCSIGHVVFRTELAAAAVAAGADVRFGATSIELERNDDWAVGWDENGHRHEVRARLIVGADGRGSRTRRRLGMPWQRTERTHVIASLLVEHTRDLRGQVLAATSNERLLLAVPQPADRARLYLISRDGRYTGRKDTARMLDDCRLSVIDDPGRFADASPVGPCATYGGEDAWVKEPAIDGAVLIGDAAGYNSPIIGQGLSLALRDARIVSELLLASDSWDRSTFHPYVQERAERLRRLRFVAQTYATLRLRPDDEVMQLADHPQLMPLLLGVFSGEAFDAPEEWFTPQMRQSLLAPVANRAGKAERVPAC